MYILHHKLRRAVVDRARWHTSEKVVVPEGIFLEYLPPYSPELQPAERLWCLADELKVNKTHIPQIFKQR
jgi:transposase